MPRSRTASCSTASPATPTRRPPTCAAAAPSAAPSPASTTAAAAPRTTRSTRVAGGELFVAAGRLIEVAGERREAHDERAGRIAGTWSASVAERVLARALASGGEFAEVFAERRGGLTMAIDESRIESVQSGAEEGAGVRVVSGGTTYFAHVDGLDPADLERAADEAAAALRGERAEPRALQAPRSRRRSRSSGGPRRCPAERKAELLRELDERGRAEGGEVAQLRASYAEAPPRGRRRQLRGPARRRRPHPGADRRPGGRPPRRTGSRPAPRRSAPTAASSCSKTTPARSPPGAARKALTLLDAVPAPAGSMPVVVGGGFGGVLFHEMTGHGLEADHVQKGASVYAGKLGEQVAQPLLNAYDDGRLPGEWGSDGDRRRGDADPEDAGDRGRPARPRSSTTACARGPRRRRLDRQRAPRELPPPADPADDQHLHRPRRRRRRRR